MQKNIKFNFLFFLVFLNLFFFSKSFANEIINFLTLKNNEVNLRQGPSFEYPIKLIYKKKFLPVEVLGESEVWRKIKDFESNVGWIHISQLSKKKSAINIVNNSVFYKKSTIYSQPIAKLEIGRMVLIKKCNLKWCKISSGGFEGWIFKKSLWGRTK